MGGLTSSIKFGPFDRIANSQQIDVSLEMFLVGALIIMAFYHTGLYLLRRTDRAPLYFGIFCLIIAIRSLFIGATVIYRLLPDISYTLAAKVEYLCLPIAVWIFILFVRKIHPSETPIKAFIAIASACVIYGSTILLTPPQFFISYLTYFQLVIVFAIGFVLFVLAKAVIRRRDGSILSSIGALTFIAAVINDILDGKMIIHTGNYISLGLFAFILCQSFILAVTFSKALTSSEELTSKLQTLNNSLEERVRERTMDLQAVNLTLKNQASIDGLTGIRNRRHFDEIAQLMLQQINRDLQSFSLFLLDIDHFKKYNDTYGHLAGDECLKQVALVLHEKAERVGGLATRFGGEEFAVIVGANSSEAVKLADQFVSAIHSLHIIHIASEPVPYVTISCGFVTTTPDQVHEPMLQDLIQAADKALYSAKQMGRNRYFVSGHS